MKPSLDPRARYLLVPPSGPQDVESMLAYTTAELIREDFNLLRVFAVLLSRNSFERVLAWLKLQ